jgi:peptidoglycan/LPS O-acetylase OafA/YrhL
MQIADNRLPLIDALKAIAAQLVVLHHLAAYGPLASAVQQMLPGLIDWLYNDVRMAVQVFLVIAGFLAARGLSAAGDGLTGSPLPMLWKRYTRLIIPFMAAIFLAMAAAAIARQWMVDPSTPTAPGFGQWLAHLFLLQGLLGVEALSAGVWYVAIDFQLFGLMVLLLWLSRQGRLAAVPGLAIVLVSLVTVASLLWFNRDASWDNWAIYFFGAYGLGALVFWASARHRMLLWLAVILTLGMFALMLDFRSRIALALTVALLLGFAQRTGLLSRWPNNECLAFLGRISYSLFLVHYPVCLLANAIYTRLGLESAAAAGLMMLAAWAASIGAATLFHRYIESPAANQRIRKAIAEAFRQRRQRILES